MNTETTAPQLMTPEQIAASGGTWYTYPELLGKQIAGRRAITTSPQYFYQYPEGIAVRTLVNIQIRREKDSVGHWWKWYRLNWERSRHGFDCGFSGYREDHAEALRVLILPEGGA